MSDHLTELFGPNDFTPPPNAPCLPTPGSTPLQIRDHTDQWVPDRQHTPAQARKLCAGCPAQTACLAEFWEDPWVIAGGTTAEERKAKRKKAAA
jgi:hypothetical protein